MSSDEYLPILQQWQNSKFRENEVNLVQAAEAARQRHNEIVHPVQRGGKWIYVYKDTGLPALFTFAVQWSSNDNLHTGNFVPDGEIVPDDVSPLNIANEKTLSRASINYNFDTSIDNSIYAHIKALEDRVKDEKTFNTGLKPRVNWQNGNDPGNEYRVTYRLFNACSSRAHRTPTEKEKKGFHEWIIAGASKLGPYRAMLNAPMPSYLSYKPGQPLRSIFKCNPPTFMEGDVVVMTFRFGIFVGRKNWKPDIMPEEFIRVAKAESFQGGALASRFQWRIEDESFERLEPNKVIVPIEAVSGVEADPPGPEDSPSEDDDVRSQVSAASLLRRASMAVSDTPDAMDVEEEGVLIDRGEDELAENVNPFVVGTKRGGYKPRGKPRK